MKPDSNVSVKEAQAVSDMENTHQQNRSRITILAQQLRLLSKPNQGGMGRTIHKL
jgi:hypothetical protein